MSTDRYEKEKVLALLQSGQEESIKLGLTIAESLQIDIEDFKQDIEIAFGLISKETELHFQQKLLEVLNSNTIVRKVASDLTFVPPQIRYLTHTQGIDFSQNKLTALPPEIKYLTQLQHLGLSVNHVTCLPVEITQLTHLRYLTLERNQLTELPIEITKLVGLTTLYLSDNQLTTIPPEISNLTNLQFLYLRLNPISQEERKKIKQLLPSGCITQF